MFQSSILSELTIMFKLLIYSNEMPRIYYTLFVYNRLFNKFVQRDFSNLLIATQSMQPQVEDIIIYQMGSQWKR